MTTSQAPAKPGTAMAQWMLLLGIAAAAVGGIVLAVANGHKASARRVLEFSGGATSSDLESAITWGYVGLGVLILGALVAVAGLTVVALRRR